MHNPFLRTLCDIMEVSELIASGNRYDTRLNELRESIDRASLQFPTDTPMHEYCIRLQKWHANLLGFLKAPHPRRIPAVSLCESAWLLEFSPDIKPLHSPMVASATIIVLHSCDHIDEIIPLLDQVVLFEMPAFMRSHDYGMLNLLVNVICDQRIISRLGIAAKRRIKLQMSSLPDKKHRSRYEQALKHSVDSLDGYNHDNESN